MKSCDQNISKINARLVVEELPMPECSTLFKLVERELAPFLLKPVNQGNRKNESDQCFFEILHSYETLTKEQFSVLLNAALDINPRFTFLSGSSKGLDILDHSLKNPDVFFSLILLKNSYHD